MSVGGRVAWSMSHSTSTDLHDDVEGESVVEAVEVAYDMGGAETGESARFVDRAFASVGGRGR